MKSRVLVEVIVDSPYPARAADVVTRILTRSLDVVSVVVVDTEVVKESA
jgi:hypothetical protein